MKTFLEDDHSDTLELLEDFVERMTEHIGLYDAWITNVNPIISEHVPGFIPYTDGGWDGEAIFGFYSDTAWSTPEIHKFHEADHEMMVDEFRRDNDLADDAEVNESVEGFVDFRDAWEQHDESHWFAKIRCMIYSAGNSRNQSGEDEALICFGINDDFGYGRDYVGAWAPGVGTKWKWERNIPFSEVTPELLAECEAAIREIW